MIFAKQNAIKVRLTPDARAQLRKADLVPEVSWPENSPKTGQPTEQIKLEPQTVCVVGTEKICHPMKETGDLPASFHFRTV